MFPRKLSQSAVFIRAEKVDFIRQYMHSDTVIFISFVLFKDRGEECSNSLKSFTVYLVNAEIEGVGVYQL